MSDPLSQTDRPGKLTTPLGADKLALARFTASEALSELFQFSVEATSTEANLDFQPLLGKAATVSLKTVDNQERYFNGVVAEARWAGARADAYQYMLVLRPWLWLLTLTSDCRIFDHKNAKDIIKQVFQDRGFSDFRDATTNTPPTLEYCVQYRETDFTFVSRLMEEYGIYYFFEHEDGKHTLVLADSKSSHKPAPGLSTLTFIPVQEGGRRQMQFVETWARGRLVETGRYVLTDYDYMKPGANLLANDDDPGNYAHDSMERFDYPGDYDEQGEGQQLATVKVQALQSQDDRRKALGQAPSLFPGALTTLSKYDEASENIEYLVVRTNHVYDGQSYRSGGVDAQRPYVGNYEMTPSSRQFRAPLDTPKPRIAGVQSALVVGKQGEEIDVDELGRIAVRFYWDRKKKASRRIRVAQFWAGGHRGALFLPRIGDEVMVQYEEGDPDRPLCVGSVYNGANTVPADLPAKKTRSGILTRSSKGGKGYNMLLFDDTAGDEHVKLRAQKALMFKALGDETRLINGNQTETVGGDETINVGGPTGGGDFTLNAFQSITLNVGPSDLPLTQIVMDQESITLNVGPQGEICQITMGPAGITLMSMAGVSMVNIGPAGVTTTAPTISETADVAINMAAPTVNAGAVLNTPSLTAAAAVVSGIPV